MNTTAGPSKVDSTTLDGPILLHALLRVSKLPHSARATRMRMAGQGPEPGRSKIRQTGHW